jgi:STAM-binding protein
MLTTLEAHSYERDGNEQDAYLFYMRHALLVMEELTKHPERKNMQYRDAWKRLNDDVDTNLAKLEQLKPKVEKRHKLWAEAAARRKAEREQWQKEHGADSLAGAMGKMTFPDQRRPSGNGLQFEKRQLDAASHRDIAAKLARKELRIRKKQRSDYQQSSPVTGPFEDQEEADDLAKRIIAAGRRGEDTLMNRDGRRSPGGTTFTPAAPRFNYPTVPQKSKYEEWGDRKMQPLIPSAYRDPPSKSILHQPAPLQPQLPPERPPKLSELYSGPPKFAELAELDSGLPQRPPKIDTTAPPVPAKVSAPSPTSRSDTATPDIKSSDYQFKPSARTESGAPLRTIFLPSELRSRFLRLAQPNTQRNLETCGILCGQLISNAFFISWLVIPEQESTSDTCDTVNEEALFDFCDTNDLITLGWIHTHPTQTCFMSSRDLHTHGGYQVQMAESIAIVCAPAHEPSWGVFRLTDPPGLKTILNCRQTGLFHPHGEANVYTDAMKPGHVVEVKGLDFEVVDLRPGKGYR